MGKEVRKEMFFGAIPLLFEKAKDLRDRTTTAEYTLWQYLRNKKLGVKFRRQHPLFLYVVDFYCHELKLVIEVDGGIHELEEIKKLDKEREINIRELGLTVIRFSNNEVLYQIEKVLEKIKSYIH